MFFLNIVFYILLCNYYRNKIWFLGSIIILAFTYNNNHFFSFQRCNNGNPIFFDSYCQALFARCCPPNKEYRMCRFLIMYYSGRWRDYPQGSCAKSTNKRRCRCGFFLLFPECNRWLLKSLCATTWLIQQSSPRFRLHTKVGDEIVTYRDDLTIKPNSDHSVDKGKSRGAAARG